MLKRKNLVGEKNENLIVMSFDDTSDLKVVLTGPMSVLRNDFEAKLSRNYQIESQKAVNGKTVFLITNETTKTVKYEKARELHVPILNEREFNNFLSNVIQANNASKPIGNILLYNVDTNTLYLNDEITKNGYDIDTVSNVLNNKGTKINSVKEEVSKDFKTNVAESNYIIKLMNGRNYDGIKEYIDGLIKEGKTLMEKTDEKVFLEIIKRDHSEFLDTYIMDFDKFKGFDNIKKLCDEHKLFLPTKILSSNEKSLELNIDFDF